MKWTLTLVAAVSLWACDKKDEAVTPPPPATPVESAQHADPAPPAEGPDGTKRPAMAGEGADPNGPLANALAEMAPTEGSQVRGTVKMIQQVGGGVVIDAHLTGLTPGDHGFHIHENGDCSAPDAKSAGGHFDPLGARHGAPADGEHHAGDLGNITADASGVARLKTTVNFVDLSTGAKSAVGKAFIVHADPDDLKSQPSGAAGARQACGVIKLVK